MSIQEALGYRAICKDDFRVQLPFGETVYEPIYEFIDAELCNGQLIGHIVELHGEPNLIITRIVNTSSYFQGRYRQKVVTKVRAIPILHKDDTRSLSELPIAEFTISRGDVVCIFDPVEF